MGNNEELLFKNIESASVENVKFLLEGGVDANCMTTSGKTPIHLAVISAHNNQNIPDNAYLNILKLLLENDADINQRDGQDCTALISACHCYNEKFIDLFIKNGIDCSAYDEGGMNALHYIARYGKTRYVETIIKRGADVNQLTKKLGFTPLDLAVGDDNFEVARQLLKNGANPNSVSKKMGLTALHGAVIKGSNRMVKLLLSYGADTSVKFDHPTEGGTPLHIAASTGSIDMIESLLKAKADPRIKDNSGNTPGDIALKFNQSKAYRILNRY